MNAMWGTALIILMLCSPLLLAVMALFFLYPVRAAAVLGVFLLSGIGMDGEMDKCIRSKSAMLYPAAMESCGLEWAAGLPDIELDERDIAFLPEEI